MVSRRSSVSCSLGDMICKPLATTALALPGLTPGDGSDLCDRKFPLSSECMSWLDTFGKSRVVLEGKYGPNPPVGNIINLDFLGKKEYCHL